MTGGRVVLAATPIGNPGDASARLLEALRTADVVAAEDTRRLARLCADLGVRRAGRVVSMHEHNERSRADQLAQQAAGGATVLVVTDAGMPTVSDPGYRVVTAAVALGVAVSTLPGPSAVLAALAVSGLPTDRFCFEGFLPRRTGERDRALAGLAVEPRTLVIFESPRRTAVTLAALAAAFGDQRPAALCRELTKTHEQVLRGSLAELARASAQTPVLGEVVLVVGGAPATPDPGLAADGPGLAAAVAAELAAGTDRRAALLAVAERAGVTRRAVYDAVVAARHGPG